MHSNRRVCFFQGKDLTLPAVQYCGEAVQSRFEKVTNITIKSSGSHENHGAPKI